MQRSSLLTFCVCSVGIFSIMTAVPLLLSFLAKNLKSNDCGSPFAIVLS